jgi:hypothetical protein
MRPLNAPPARPSLPTWAIFPILCVAVAASHASLLRLPYYWDEAGYYIPAAWDFFRTGSLIPSTTLTNAHPPLPSLYLALWWKLFAFTPLVTRLAMACVAAIALTAVWTIALRATARYSVAFATVLLTALYPVVFAQSTLAHADLFAAAATLWAIAFLLQRTSRGTWLAAFCFSLAALSKETAIITPLALAAWLLIQPQAWATHVSRLQRGNTASPNHLSPSEPGFIPGLKTSAILTLPTLPLILWYLYHRHRTGYIFGNPEYLRYNAAATLTPLRILIALGHRILHVTAHMNLFVPVALMLACMILPPLQEKDTTPRPRIAPAGQAIFYVVIAANVLFFSVLGGALLTRYLLPLYPLILLLCVNTFRRRFAQWPALVALSAVAFLAGIFINPPYRFAPEDNLAYANVIRLHQAAIAQIVAHDRYDTVLTAWPATDELSKPELGYVTAPIKVTAIDNFSWAEIEKAARQPETYSAAFLFSTKYDPPHLPLSLGSSNEQLDKRFFDFHVDLSPETAARILRGDLVWEEQHQGQWAAILHFNRAEDAQTPARRRRIFAEALSSPALLARIQ